MASSRNFRAGLAAIALVFALSVGVMLIMPAPETEAQTTRFASAESSTAPRARAGAFADRLRVIDGDTLEDMRDDITYRVVNIDTPETGSRARCIAERELGNRATQAARTLVSDARRLEFRPTGRTDRYGRTVAFVVIDGRDMGETLIEAGLARPWRGRREPWCDAGGNLIP